MKVEEIKLALEKNIQFALIDDLKKELSALQTMGGSKASEISSISSSLLSGKTVALSLAQKAEKAIAQAKELGIDSAQFDFINKSAISYSKVLDLAAKNLVKYNSEL
jgi:hypothetical protein